MNTTQAITRDAEELQGLKDAWHCDPIWDIEHTEGFEAHYDELLEYRKHWEQVWKDRRSKHLQRLSNKMGVPGNVTLAKYIECLETHIDALEDRIDKLEGIINS